MALDGIAGVQARIQEIERIVAGASGSSAPVSGTANEPSPEFASLLSDAMAGDASGLGSGLGSTGLGNTAPEQSSLGGSFDMSGLLSQVASGRAGAVGGLPSTTGGSPIAQEFLQTALAERGKPYVYGASASPSDANPRAFDCSELTKWAAARVGVTIPDGATAQYLYARDHRTTMTVDQALHTPGALLFHFGHEPRNLGDIPADGHVAISVGDGVHTIEARGHAYGTGVFEATPGRFNFAGMIPQMA